MNIIAEINKINKVKYPLIMSLKKERKEVASNRNKIVGTV